MARSDMLKITVAGDLARILSLEAARSGISPQEIATGILSRSLAEAAMGLAEGARRGPEPQDGPSSSEIKTVRSVLSKAYGPTGRSTNSRRSRHRG